MAMTYTQRRNYNPFGYKLEREAGRERSPLPFPKLDGPARHWHVATGTEGYEPDNVAVFTNRRDAELEMKDMATDWRDEGMRVRGNATWGWYRAGELGHYVQALPCVDPNCQLEED